MDKELLNIISKYFTKDTSFKLLNNKLSYNNYIMIYNDINNDINKINKSSYDINKLLKHKKNNIIKLFRKFVKDKNIYILKKALKTKYWNMNIESLKFQTNLNNNNIQKKYIELFKKKYLYSWDGYWSSIKLNNKGNIIDINTIDINDINFIKN